MFSADTVARAPECYQKALGQPYRSEGRDVSEGFYNWWLSSPGNPTVAAIVARLPEWFQQRRFGMAVWQWIGLLLAIPISLTIMHCVDGIAGFDLTLVR